MWTSFVCSFYCTLLVFPLFTVFDDSIFPVCVALVITAAELEQLGSYSPGVHGFPHLRWGQSSATKVYPQAWQVRHNDPDALQDKHKDTHLHISQHSWHPGCCNHTFTERRFVIYEVRFVPPQWEQKSPVWDQYFSSVKKKKFKLQNENIFF